MKINSTTVEVDRVKPAVAEVTYKYKINVEQRLKDKAFILNRIAADTADVAAIDADLADAAADGVTEVSIAADKKAVQDAIDAKMAEIDNANANIPNGQPE